MALAFDASGGRLAAAGEDDTLRVWDVDSPHTAMLLAERPYGAEVTAIAFGPTGQLAIGGADGRVRVWEFVPPESRWRPAGQGHDGGVLALAWDAEEEHWISVGTDGRLRAGGGQQQPVVAHGRVRAAAVSPGTGQGAVIDHRSGRIHTFRIGDQGSRQDLQGSDNGLTGVAFGPSGDRSSSAAPTASCTSGTRRSRPYDPPTPHRGSGIGAVAGSPDGRLAAVCRDGWQRDRLPHRRWVRRP